MASKLNVALIQADLAWEKPSENRESFSRKINQISEEVDLILLPEMFTSGFTMNPESVAECMEGETIQWLKKIAENKKSAIAGSLVIKENDSFYNRLVFIESNGNIISYDKKHTFTLAGEHKVYKAGTKKVIIDYKGWKICPLVCYDLRFPVWARNTEDYDLLFYVANWPKPRIAAWDILLKARAIENMSYCIGVNRVGLDANKHEYSGHSACYDVLGKRIDQLPFEQKGTGFVTLEKSHIAKYRDKLQFLNDRDTFNLKV